jgi:hypothetical protein
VPNAKRDNLIDTPAYTLREVARLTGINFGTLHAWSHGFSPIIRLAGDYWSFTNLVEAHTLRTLRRAHGIRLSDVRKAVLMPRGPRAHSIHLRRARSLPASTPSRSSTATMVEHAACIWTPIAGSS